MFKTVIVDYIRIFKPGCILQTTRRAGGWGISISAFWFGLVMMIAMCARDGSVEDIFLVLSVMLPLYLMIYSNLANYCLLEKMVYLCPLSKSDRCKLSIKKYIFKIVFEMMVAACFMVADMLFYKDIKPIGFILLLLSDLSVCTCLWTHCDSRDEKIHLYQMVAYVAGIAAILTAFLQLPIIDGAKGGNALLLICAIVYVLLILPCTIIGTIGSIGILKERAIAFKEVNKEKNESNA